jgi:hypothetical protein
MSALLSWVLLCAGGQLPTGDLVRDAPMFRDPDAGPVAPGLPPLPFTWELPPKTVHEVPIDGTTSVAGVPVRLRYLLVKGTPHDLGLHFLQSFKRQGLYIAPKQAIDRLLTGVDPQSIATYSVVLQPNEAGHTTVILGESRILERKPEVNGLPLPPSAQAPIPVQFEGHTVLSFKVNDPVEEVRRFYGRELPLRGWRPGDEGGWLKEGERLRVTVRADGRQSQVVLEQRRAER